MPNSFGLAVPPPAWCNGLGRRIPGFWSGSDQSKGHVSSQSRWWPASLPLDLGDQAWDIPRSLKGSSEDVQSSQGSGKRTLAKREGTFFFSWREFYLRAENSRNAGRADAFGGGLKAPPRRSPGMGLLPFHHVQSCRDGRRPASQAPPGVVEEAAGGGVTRAPGGRRSWDRAAESHTAQRRESEKVVFPRCSGQHFGL